MTRGAIDFNRPGIPIVASLPSVHIAETYGKAHRGRTGTVKAITEWADQHDVPLVDLKAAVAEHIMSGRGNPDGIHWNFEAHQAVAELMLKGLQEAGVSQEDDPVAMAVIVVTDSSSRLQPEDLRAVRYPPGAAAHPAGRQGFPRRRRRRACRRPPAPRHHRGRHACRTRRRLPGSARRRAAATAWWPCTYRRRCRAPTAPRCLRRVSSVPRCASSTRGRPRWVSGSSRWPPREAAAAGADLNAVEAAARSAVPRGHAFIVVHRLDNLRRSGRIRRGASLVGFRAVAEAAAVPRRRRQAGAGPADPDRHQGARSDDRSGRRGGRRPAARGSPSITSTTATPPTTSPRR